MHDFLDGWGGDTEGLNPEIPTSRADVPGFLNSLREFGEGARLFGVAQRDTIGVLTPGKAHGQYLCGIVQWGCLLCLSCGASLLALVVPT